VNTSGAHENQNNIDDLHAKLVCGLELLERKKYQESESYIEAVLNAQPLNPELMHLLGVINYQSQNLPKALDLLVQSVQLNPSNSKAHYNLGLVLYDLHRLEDAIESYTKAIELNPHYCDALSNRGAALFDLNKLNDAIKDLNLAVQIDPNHANAHINLGNTLHLMQRLDDALLSYKKAIDLEPLNAIAHWGYATTLLHTGQYDNGFVEFEWRVKNPRLSSLFNEKYKGDPWTGKDSLLNKTILLHSEQGLGDTIQFCRYIKKVKELGAEIYVCAEEPLLKILSDIPGVTKVFKKGSDTIPDHDYHCSFLSLPYAFSTSLNSLPNSVPYLPIDIEKKMKWQKKMGAKVKPRIGLVWSGGYRPHNPELYLVNNRRNIQLEKFLALEDLDIEIYSLQKGKKAENELKEFSEQHTFGSRIIDFTNELSDFTDTAALIENLDLVISVDTSTAHLAGALGRPVWILNRFDNCWRWLANREDSPWYPSARLFRQQANGDWDMVMNRVKDQLTEYFQL
jgi:tetratricopeptide (TPR) repeat protein